MKIETFNVIVFFLEFLVMHTAKSCGNEISSVDFYLKDINPFSFVPRPCKIFENQCMYQYTFCQGCLQLGF